MLKIRTPFPAEGFAPDAVDSMIVKIFIKAIVYSFVVNMGAISEKIGSLSLSLFRIVVFAKGQFLYLDDFVLKVEEKFGLQNEKTVLFNLVAVFLGRLVFRKT